MVILNRQTSVSDRLQEIATKSGTLTESKICVDSSAHA